MIEDTQPIPILRDYLCPGCGKGTSHIGRRCLDCEGSQCTPKPDADSNGQPTPHR